MVINKKRILQILNLCKTPITGFNRCHNIKVMMSAAVRKIMVVITLETLKSPGEIVRVNLKS